MENKLKIIIFCSVLSVIVVAAGVYAIYDQPDANKELKDGEEKISNIDKNSSKVSDNKSAENSTVKSSDKSVVKSSDKSAVKSSDKSGSKSSKKPPKKPKQRSCDDKYCNH